MSNPKLNRWRKLFEQFENSPLGTVAFCREHRLPLHQFYYWRDKLAAAAEPSIPASMLVPVVFEPSSVLPHLASELPLLRAHLPNGVEISGFTPEQLCALLPAVAAL